MLFNMYLLFNHTRTIMDNKQRQFRIIKKFMDGDHIFVLEQYFVLHYGPFPSGFLPLEHYKNFLLARKVMKRMESRKGVYVDVENPYTN